MRSTLSSEAQGSETCRKGASWRQEILCMPLMAASQSAEPSTYWTHSYLGPQHKLRMYFLLIVFHFPFSSLFLK